MYDEINRQCLEIWMETTKSLRRLSFFAIYLPNYCLGLRHISGKTKEYNICTITYICKIQHYKVKSLKRHKIENGTKYHNENHDN